ncbi:sugar transferase [Georgenia sp. MJ170]|uniref:sugar transferase n=1 Tax=Georgenia sunbinii TaxID=3117728 RepID=UPI002F2622A7
MNVRTFDRLKRGVDLTAAAVGLVVTSPIQLIIAGLVRVKLGSPVLFRQERPGKDTKIFTLVKFRTMAELDHSKGLVTDAERLTRLGRLLRATSLDELPTLWNVLRGDMSLVGPRPLRTYYLPRYSSEQARRHGVRPGITGLAQVSGRNSLPWEQRFRLDVHYVDQRSLALDVKILLSTVRRVVSRAGVSADGHATMTPFLGAQGND